MNDELFIIYIYVLQSHLFTYGNDKFGCSIIEMLFVTNSSRKGSEKLVLLHVPFVGNKSHFLLLTFATHQNNPTNINNVNSSLTLSVQAKIYSQLI